MHRHANAIETWRATEGERESERETLKLQVFIIIT